MTKPFIPAAKKTYRVLEQVEISLDWVSRNLVLLRELGYTEMKQQESGYLVLRDENGDYVRDDRGDIQYSKTYRNVTSVNPLYVKDNGKTVSVPVYIQKDTTFTLSEYRDWGNRAIWVKFLTSPDKGFSKRVAEISIEDFQEMDIEEV